MLSHSSIRISLYVIKTIKAISFLTSPQVRAYFLSFMGRNQFKKVRSHPLKSRRQKKYTKEKGCHSNMRCTPSTRHAHFAAHQKYVIVCRRFLVFMGFPDAFLPPCTPCTPFFQ